MTSRELVIRAVAERMQAAFGQNNLVDAQNLEGFLRMLEGLTDEAYEAMANEEVSGALS